MFVLCCIPSRLGQTLSLSVESIGLLWREGRPTCILFYTYGTSFRPSGSCPTSHAHSTDPCNSSPSEQPANLTGEHSSFPKGFNANIPVKQWSSTIPISWRSARLPASRSGLCCALAGLSTTKHAATKYVATKHAPTKHAATEYATTGHAAAEYASPYAPTIWRTSTAPGWLWRPSAPTFHSSTYGYTRASQCFG